MKELIKKIKEYEALLRCTYGYSYIKYQALIDEIKVEIKAEAKEIKKCLLQERSEYNPKDGPYSACCYSALSYAVNFIIDKFKLDSKKVEFDMYDLNHEKVIIQFNIMLVGDEDNLPLKQALEILKMSNN